MLDCYNIVIFSIRKLKKIIKKESHQFSRHVKGPKPTSDFPVSIETVCTDGWDWSMCAKCGGAHL
jgi:hypothetical protein